MPCSMEWYGRILHWKFDGAISESYVARLFNEFYGHAKFEDTRAQIRNYIDSEREIDVESVARIAAIDCAAAQTNPSMKIALVTGGKEPLTTLASYYDAELIDSPWLVEIFDTFEEALSWAK